MIKTFFTSLIIIFLLNIPFPGKSQSSTITSWAEKKTGVRKLCFYPSTLRMINISKDEAFNRSVKDVKKLKIFLSDSKNNFDKKEINALKAGIKTENYKDMLQVRNGSQSFYVYIKEKNDEPQGFAGIVVSETGLILIDLEGFISPEIIQQLISGKINFEVLTKINDLSKATQNNQNPPQKK